MSFSWRHAKTLAHVGCAFSFLSLISGAAHAQQIAANSGRLSAAANSNFGNQFQALQAIKANLTPAQRKLATPLTFSTPTGKALIGRSFASFRGFAPAGADGRSDVIVTAKVTPKLLSAISRAGGAVISVLPGETGVRALLSPEGTEKVAALDEVSFIRLYVAPHTNAGDTGDIVSEGDIAHSAAPTRELFKVSGKGIKIGVLSDGVNSLAKAQVNKELPAKVTVIANGQGVVQKGSGDEGTAMLEIVHDIAPDAQLFFATGNGGQEVMADNIKRLRKAGCNIIVDDLIYFAEGVYQDGVIAQAVSQVVDDGALYFSSAGNEGNFDAKTSGTWDGQFRSGGTYSTTRGLAKIHLWDGEVSNPVISTNGAEALASLQWADPLGKSKNDYDMYVLDAKGNVVSASQDVQDGTSDPYESVACSAGEKIVVTLQSGEGRPLFLQMFRGKFGVSTANSIYGHAASTKAVGVAAVSALVSNDEGATRPFQNKDVVETFSTDGYRTYYFDPAGNKKTFVVKAPQITAADGVSTSIPGFRQFYGTSAAAPHAAALAALVWSFNLKQSPESIKQTLYSTAIDIMNSGFDRNSGYGIVMADRAVASIAPPVMTISPTTISTNEADSGSKTIKVTVSLSKANDVDTTVTYATKAVTARNNVDFVGKSGTLTIPKGAKSVDVFFAINGDTEVESNETFQIKFAKPSTIFTGENTVNVTIVDNDKDTTSASGKSAASS